MRRDRPAAVIGWHAQIGGADVGRTPLRGVAPVAIPAPVLPGAIGPLEELHLGGFGGEMLRMNSVRFLIGLAVVAIAGCSAAPAASTPPAATSASPAASEAAASEPAGAPVSFSYMTFG